MSRKMRTACTLARLWRYFSKSYKAVEYYWSRNHDIVRDCGTFVIYYMAGVEVDKDTALPEGMYRKVVQKAKYAVFTVNGNNANGEIGKAFQYIYFVWLPNSEYCIDENALFEHVQPAN